MQADDALPLPALIAQAKEPTFSMAELLKNEGIYKTRTTTLNDLAVCIYKGTDGIEPNKIRARSLFKHCAHRRDIEAKYNLAMCFLNDEPKAPEKAYRIFESLIPYLSIFEKKKDIIYFYSGMYFFDRQDFKKAQEYFSLVSPNSPQSNDAEAKIKQMKGRCCSCVML